MIRFCHILLCAALAVGLVAPQSALARHRDVARIGHMHGMLHRIQNEAPISGKPLPEIIDQIQKAKGGEFVSARPMKVDGQDAYLIRLKFDGGRFEDYVVDAQTGRIVGDK